ncbi:hypothetical protein F5Y19DRAFT_455084 [Xylariaceae sp. FL1651]|nr:hypothetical protein F5Y19DRAFT_455084 [Xylariaceae sp. FL1651]
MYLPSDTSSFTRLLTTTAQVVCGRPLAKVVANIWFHPDCRTKKTAWLARTQAQLPSVRSWGIDSLFDQMYGPDRDEQYRLIVTPKVGNSLYAELNKLIKDGVVGTELTQTGCRVVWPDWTMVWTWPTWNRDRTEASAKAMMRAAGIAVTDSGSDAASMRQTAGATVSEVQTMTGAGRPSPTHDRPHDPQNQAEEQLLSSFLDKIKRLQRKQDDTNAMLADVDEQFDAMYMPVGCDITTIVLQAMLYRDLR